MNISKKWSAVAAGLLTVALMGGGAVSANAADPVISKPQPNGSPGAFYIFNGDTGEYADSDGTRIYDRAEGIIISASPTDVNAEIMPGDYAAPGSYDGIYKFVAKADAIAGGENTWRAWAPTAAAGPNGGILNDEFTLQSRGFGNSGGIESVFTQGGDWVAGIAFTKFNGVQTVAAVYRTIHVEAGTGKFTVDPVAVDGPAPADTIVESDLVAPELGSAEPAVDTTVVPLAAGAANANKTLKVAVFAGGARVELGTVVLDGNGNGSVDVAGKGLAVNTAHKIFAYDNSGADEVLAGWDSFTLTESQVRSDTTDLSVEVTNSGKFSLVAPAAQSIDLGDVRRDQVSAPVALGAVTVFDDRDVLSGWNLNINSTAFTGPGATTVAATALGYAPTGTNLPAGITAGVAKVAGEGSFGVLAEGAVNSATGEFDGAVIDTNLTFKAPINAAKGVHTATLTLDLVSK